MQVNLLIVKIDLEIAKADAEYSIESDKAFAALLALVGAFLQWYIPGENENFSYYIELIGRLLVFAPSAFMILNTTQKSIWLHVIKIAIALTSELSSTNVNSTNSSYTPK